MPKTCIMPKSVILNQSVCQRSWDLVPTRKRFPFTTNHSINLYNLVHNNLIICCNEKKTYVEGAQIEKALNIELRLCSLE